MENCFDNTALGSADFVATNGHEGHGGHLSLLDFIDDITDGGINKLVVIGEGHDGHLSRTT